MKLIITFCEGWHDAAFIYKLLKNKSYQYKNDKITDLPNILRDHFKELFKKFEYSDTGKIKQNPNYPNFLLKKKNDEIYILLYVIDGVDKLKNALPIIETFKDLSEATLDTPEIPIAFHFILDAEDLNIQQRIDKIVKELKTEIDLTGLTQGKILNKNLQIKAASVYIFSDKKKNNGKLENILIPLMKKDNEEIFEQAEKYIKNNYNKTRNKKNQNFDKDKSIINIAGQLQKSGKANTVIITDTDYITKNKIKKNETCNEIIDTFLLLEKELKIKNI